MGMSASQARFLGLTARKNNVEYRGQQINQARTALANQTSTLFNEMLSLKVPTPPVVSDYYNTSYTYSDGDKECEIVDGLGTNSCTIKITEKKIKNYVQPVNSGNQSTLSWEDNVPYINGYRLTQLSGDNGNKVSTIKIESILKDGVKINEENPGFVMSNGGSAVSVRSWDEYQQYQNMGYTLDDNASDNILYSYSKNGKAYYIQSTYIPDNDEMIHKILVPQEFYEESYLDSMEKTMTNCTWDKDKSGRYTTVSGEMDGKTMTKSLTFNQTEDSEAYEQAMIDYKYKYAVYEKEVEDINAKTAKIQEQDRSLELQLRECDTEQEALKTELDSVKKVIEENVTRVFKTFQA